MVQDPATAVRPEMPQAAIDTGMVDVVADIDGLAARLGDLISMSSPGARS
jgi:chemotaxis response regulator CheB